MAIDHPMATSGWLYGGAGFVLVYCGGTQDRPLVIDCHRCWDNRSGLPVRQVHWEAAHDHVAACVPAALPRRWRVDREDHSPVSALPNSPRRGRASRTLVTPSTPKLLRGEKSLFHSPPAKWHMFGSEAIAG